MILVGMTGRLSCGSAHLHKSYIPMIDTLVNDIERQFTYMWYTFMFLLNILDEFLTLGSATLIETWVDGIFIWVDQFAHRHS